MSAPELPNIVITGGRGGLAAAIAARFAQGEWQVDAPGRDVLDVTSPASVAGYFSRHSPTLLVCNAGLTRDAPLGRISPDDWQRVFDVNYHGAHRCARAVLPGMLRRACGHIVFISSHSALHPPAGQAGYAAAKAAVVGLAQALALEAGADGVRVNVILPGFLETPMTTGVSAERKAAVLGDHALGRFNTPECVAGFIWHLHHELPHTSGQVFQLDSRRG